MKDLKGFLLTLIFVVTLSANIFAANPISDDGIWQEISDVALKHRSNERSIIPNAYKTFRADKKQLTKILEDAPKESFGMNQLKETVLTMPMPDGSFSRFRIQNSSIMEPALAAKYPEITSYIAQGIDDPTATARFDMSPVGFRAMILSTNGTTMIEPYAKNDSTNYISFDKKNVERKGDFVCEFQNPEELLETRKNAFFDFDAPAVINGTSLRTYRLAMAATGEYTTFFRQAGDTDAQAVARALAAINTTMNRVNAVYERDLAVRMILIGNTDSLIYTNAATDPYQNTSGDLAANQSNIDTVIGSPNYDIGHLVGTGGGGVASLNVPCSAGSKARGLTGRGSPVGDAFDIDYVAHEIGHQFGGLHTFNGSVGNCAGGNRSSSAAYETGSGITIMAYAGICGTQDLARNSIDTFHVKSLEQIVAFINGGGNCSLNTGNGNTPPAVPTVQGSSFNVPRQTPFALSATTTDVNNDSITYDWQEYNLGASTTAVPNTDSDGVRPVFRPYLPTASGIRYFPSLRYILNNSNVPPSTYDCGRGVANPCLTGELMPAITRTMNFQVVARDNRAGGGGINSATATVLVDAGSGPFVVTAPNTNVSAPSNVPLNVTWSVANTTAAPVSAANVRISLSTDGGLTFPVVLRSSTPNDGSDTVTLPAVNSTSARIKIEGESKIFFDISDVNFSISAVATARPPYDFDGDGKTDVSVFRPSVGQWYFLRSSNSIVSGATFGTSTDKPVAADYTGDGKTDLAFFVPSTNQWFVLRSEDSSYYAFPFGASGDIPVPADYDGDGKADVAVFRPSTGVWYINRSTGGTTIQSFGISTDVPVVADYDGDGKSDIAIFRPSVGEWYFIRSSDSQVRGNQFGSSTDKPVQGDYTGDGKADLAFFRPSTGSWFVLRSEDASFFASPFGISTDTPTPGDYDGDGKFDQAVFRSSSAVWYLNRSTAGVQILNFGATTDLPLPARNN